jgi:hypothetical protein
LVGVPDITADGCYDNHVEGRNCHLNPFGIRSLMLHYF